MRLLGKATSSAWKSYKRKKSGATGINTRDTQRKRPECEPSEEARLAKQGEICRLHLDLGLLSL